MQHDATMERTESLPLTVQEWDRYTPEQHAVWGLLYARRMATLRDTASRVFLEGATTIGLERDRVPDLARINARLRPLTGWCAIPVEGFLPAAQFFQCLAVRRFPTTVTVRAREAIDYVPEPDIFHDVFGHVPLHANPVFAAVLQRLGELGSAARSEQALREVTRLFWFTVEFGLVREGGGTRIYGSGLISSHGDAANALGPNCERRPFRLKHLLAQPFEIDVLQPVLFVLDSFEQLFDAVASL
jgi:phenylalanine-4-hydroxylase